MTLGFGSQKIFSCSHVAVTWQRLFRASSIFRWYVIGAAWMMCFSFLQVLKLEISGVDSFFDANAF